MTKLDQKERFRRALRCMAASVSVVSATDGKNNAGMTISSAVSVSFDPLSLLICINQDSLFYDMVHGQDKFCLNLLKQSQTDISAKFSRPASEKDLFKNGDWGVHMELPYLKDAQANFFLEIKKVTHFGTHGIFIGEVIDVFYSDQISPLIYLDGSYMNE